MLLYLCLGAGWRNTYSSGQLQSRSAISRYISLTFSGRSGADKRQPNTMPSTGADTGSGDTQLRRAAERPAAQFISIEKKGMRMQFTLDL